MKKAHVIFAIVLVIVSATASYAADAGQAVFASKCQMCHGADGAGKTPMGAKLGITDLRADAVQSKAAPELEKLVATGKNKMQGYEGKLSKQQIADVVAYVKTFKK